jgi:hypothetical protein
VITAISPVTLVKVEITESFNSLKAIIFENYLCNDLLSLRIKDWSSHTLTLMTDPRDLEERCLTRFGIALLSIFKIPHSLR